MAGSQVEFSIQDLVRQVIYCYFKLHKLIINSSTLWTMHLVLAISKRAYFLSEGLFLDFFCRQCNNLLYTGHLEIQPY